MWRTYRISGAALVLLALGLSGCRQDMHDQLKLEPLEGSTLFSDGRGSRDPVEGTVARGQLNDDRHLHEGRRTVLASEKKAGGGDIDDLVDTFPFEVTRTELERGRERYDIFCAPCHARTGKGDGMVVRRGYRRPPALWEEKLRQAPVGLLFDVVTRGFGAMPAYARQIPVRDRWTIIAYLRALQFAHHAELDSLPAAEKQRALDALSQPATEPATVRRRGEHARGPDE